MSSIVEDFNLLLTGDEKYEIAGYCINHDTIRHIFKQCKGMNRHWNCIEKAQRVIDMLGVGRVHIGAMMVYSEDYSSSYGFHYNPPLEFHAWVDMPEYKIIDVALPGVIERGLKMEDVLKGREPVILNGRPEKWMVYQTAVVL